MKDGAGNSAVECAGMTALSRTARPVSRSRKLSSQTRTRVPCPASCSARFPGRAWILAITPALLLSSPAPAISFNDDIRPILADRCFSCHGPDSASRKADLRLDLEESAKSALKDGSIPIVPGDPSKSTILYRITHGDPDEVMPPPASKLTVSPQEVSLLREWIAQGATWEKHWAFIPPKNSPPALPSDATPGDAKRSEASWPRNEIDHFILAGLAEHGLRPSPPADRARLLRRLTFDLTGLPPTLAELDAFLLDNTDQAYERVVDRLLASPAFGERLALEWLDVARYGDTDGLFEDHPRSIFPWRDWVVTAFNDNLPYDQFLTWQLAGDLLPDATDAQKIATGFLRNNPTSNEGGIIDEDYRIKYLIDRVNTTATAFLGLTIECAQCHDHKFDPISQRDYYQFAAFFNSMVGRGNTKGATAPTLRILAPEKEQRLGGITTELAALEKSLQATPPALESDFAKWNAQIAQPIEWFSPTLASSTHDRQDENQTTVPESSVRGRYLRLALPPNETGFLTISEVEVYSGGRNVARAGTARQSSNYGNKNRADRAVDGKADGSFASCACTREEKEAWWELDLGSEVPIDHILVYNRNDCCPERLDNVALTILDAQRGPVKELKIGDAPFRSSFTLNPDARPPQPSSRSYEVVLDPGDVEEPLTALRITADKPALVESLRVDLLSAKPRELKLTGNTKFKVGPEVASHIAGIEKPVVIAPGEQLKLTLGTASAVTVQVTTDPTALTRATMPADPAERLARFRATWPGFAEIRARRDSLAKEKQALEKSAVVTMIAGDEAIQRTTHILMRGEYDKPGEAVNPSAPASILPYDSTLPPNRLGLARWMTDPANPLTARVAVNRYWQMIFGRGLVQTSEDFGTQGSRPSHQALLDHLAVEFAASGWDLKKLLRRIVLSSTYRQSSVRSPGLAELDPANRLLARAPRQRLPAEFIRDHALSVSGLLVNKRGGPGVHPYQPAVLFGRNAIGAAGASFKQSSGDDLYRRSLYTYWKRQIPAANMRILGADGRNACRTRRERTNTPLQALVLLNDPQFVEAARVLAERIMTEGGTATRDRLAYAFRLATSRRPSRRELAILYSEFNDRLEEFKRDPASAKAYLAGSGERKANPALDASELAAFAAVSSLILNLDESISKS